MVRETPDQGMPVVQMEMQVLADRADRMDDVEHIPRRAFDRGLDVCDQIRQPAVLRVKVPQAQARMAAREPGRRLPHTDVAHIDTATDALRVVEPLRHLYEPPRFQAGRVLEKDERTARPLTQTRIERPITLSSWPVRSPISCLSWTTRPAMRPAKRSANSPTTP